MGIIKGVTVSFDYSKGETVERRVGVVEKVLRSAGKSSVKANRGQKLVMLNIVESGAAYPKSFHRNKMSNIQVI